MEHSENINPLNDGLVSLPPDWEVFLDLLGVYSMSPTVEEEVNKYMREVVSRMTGTAVLLRY